MSDQPKGPPVLRRASGFAGATGDAEVGPEAAIAADLRLGGSLDGASPLRLAALVAANQAAGRLELIGETYRTSLIFKRGVLEHAASTDPEDDLGHHLLAKGLVTADQVAAAAQAAAGHGNDLFAALVAQRAVDPSRSFQVLQDHGAALACAALGTEKGHFLWEPKVAPPPSGFPLVPRWSLVCDAVRRLDGLTLRRRLAPRMALAPYKVGGRVALTDLKLTALEARLAGTLDGGISLADRVQAAGGEADTLLRVVLLLAETELLAFGEPRPGAASALARTPEAAAPKPAAPAPAVPPEAAAPKPAAPAASRPPPAAPPRPQAAAPARAPAPAKAPATAKAPAPAAPAAPPPATDLASLKAALARVSAAADHFAVLGLQQSATGAQIKAAYFALAKAWHPDAGTQGEAEEIHHLRVGLFARLSEAWGVLGDDAQRKQYLDDLRTGAGTSVDVAAILQAEGIFQQATVLVKTRQYPAALAELDKAIQLNGDEPEFHAWRAWVLFLLASDQKRQQAASAAEIEAALKKLPRLVKGYLFLGQMAKIAGDPALAERHFKRGLAVEPEDIDLQRELRYLRK